MAAIEVRRIDQATALGSLAPEWDKLAERCAAWPCQYPGWLDAWYAAFGRGRLEVLAAWTGETLTGVVPLLGRLGSLRSPTNWHTARFGVLAAGPDERAALADALMQRSPVRLSFIQEGDATATELRRAAESSGHRVLERPLPPSPYLRTSGDRAVWWDGLSARMRRELRRRRRKLEEQGPVGLEVHDGTGQGDVYLAEGFAIEGSEWKERKGTAIRSRPETLGFYRRIARWAAARGALRLTFLRLDGRPIAFDFALEDGRSHYLLKTGFDRRLAPFAPGQLLRQEMIDRAFSNGLETYEFLGMPEPWKLVWTGTTRGREELVILPPTLRGRVGGAVHGKLLPLARRTRAAWLRG
jgi:CelD/BcsL family acetyltransferase involved in cellulose biosynthesis